MKINTFVVVGSGSSLENALKDAKQKVLTNIHVNNDFRNAGILLKNDVSLVSVYNPGADIVRLAKTHAENMGDPDKASPANAYSLSKDEKGKSLQYLFFGRS
jgi:hypothetical protein